MAYDEDDMLYNRNVTYDIEVGMDINVARQDGLVMLGGEMDDINIVDDLEYPSFEELMLEYSSDKDIGHHF
ncbi:Hypothetical predicted protein [Olea europaea subsp. europaea]|uniref:Uncharacterized protein n=1 Tax=Olea europaea subsp. europaea TaxID=158383 RepID=A0A8S0SWV6_OLEEU|nr:Hypothetical predicted protein [Olea europaea subsp. europaea]